jgi:hypothetical protein
MYIVKKGQIVWTYDDPKGKRSLSGRAAHRSQFGLPAWSMCWSPCGADRPEPWGMLHSNLGLANGQGDDPPRYHSSGGLDVSLEGTLTSRGSPPHFVRGGDAAR